MFRNSFYGDAVRELDWGVGRILSAVKRSASPRRTLVVFTSDNGAALGAFIITDHFCLVDHFLAYNPS
jgi:arylsulfatase A-like enzyme